MPNWCWAINTNSAVISEELCPVDPCTRKKLLHAILETAQVSSKVLVFVASPFLRNTTGEKLTQEVEHSHFPGLWPSELSRAREIWLSFPCSALGSLCSWCKVRTVCWYIIHMGTRSEMAVCGAQEGIWGSRRHFLLGNASHHAIGGPDQVQDLHLYPRG